MSKFAWFISGAVAGILGAMITAYAVDSQSSCKGTAEAGEKTGTSGEARETILEEAESSPPA